MNIMLLNRILVLYAASMASQAVEPAAKILDDFNTTQAFGSWMSVNDGVMGGRSKGGPTISKQHHLVFKGDISLENNGGFSSIRTQGKTIQLSLIHREP